ncbi:hypothetical protein VCHC41A1_1057, partial [Vibrio cholerae HC-41A1]
MVGDLPTPITLYN